MIGDAIGDSFIARAVQPWLLLVSVALGGCGTDGDDVGLNQPLASIPGAYRGSWKMDRPDGVALPSPYPDYEVEIAGIPDQCAVLKDKGVSRLLMFQGATATLTEGARSLILTFSIDDGRRFELNLSESVDSAIAGHVRHSKVDEVLLDAEVRLVPREASD